MHTAEHILNQTMIRLFKTGRCFSAHIEKKKSKCDYLFDQPLSADEEKMIEDKMNEIINEDLKVEEVFIEKDKAAEKFDLGRLPEGTEGKIRVVRIGDYDAVPCIGQHVTSTKELGIFRVISTSHENGILRIRFKLHGTEI